ncbi:MAG TPA: helix-turn-helix domain-containing protein [Thermohalobaculum sp.]|nr:helix-turn-helix domain-containing protein [Thermohalobaculum sp.]
MNEKTVKSAVRVLAIFEVFERERRALTISELVERLQIPQSSTSTLMRSLVTKGFVEFDAESRRYRPSVRLAFLGNWVLGSTNVIARIHTLAQTLSERTGETILVGSENGLFMQYLSVIVSPHTVRIALHPGLKRPLHRSGLGLMLLSLKTDAEIGRLVRRYNAELAEADGSRYTERQTLEMVEKARRQGWYETASIIVEGAGSIATLLPLPRGQRPLAIGIGAPVDRLQSRHDVLHAALTEAVAEFKAATTDLK